MKRRIVALLLVLILVLGALAGCGSKTEEPTPSNTPEQPSNSGEKEPEKEPEPTGNFKPTTTSKSENSLRVPVSGEYGTFDPNHTGLSEELNVYPQLYEGLYAKDSNEEWGPAIAKSYELQDDGSVIFELRDDVYFHNGEHMTADDVVYSHRRTELSTQINYVYDYTTIEKIDDLHVKISFVAPEAAGFDMLKDYILQFPIMCKSWCEAISDDPLHDMLLEENGTGAYYIESIDPTTKDIVLKKFDKYWGTAHIDTIYLKTVTGDREMAFEAGDIDYASYKFGDLVNIEAFDNVQQRTELSGVQNYLVLNCSRPPFDDINVRKAVAYALDREEIGMIAIDNGGQVAWNCLSEKLKEYRDVVEHLDNEPDKARELMAAAGYSEAKKAPVVIVSAANNPTAEILKERLDQCYFDCSIENTTDSSRIFNGDFDIVEVSLILGDLGGFGGLIADEFNLAQYWDYDLANRMKAAQTEEEIVQTQKEFNELYAYIPIAAPATYFVLDSDLEFDESESMSYYGIDFYYRTLKWK